MKQHTTNQETKAGRKAASPTGKFQELTVPYWFSSTARRRQEDIQIGDYVRVSGLRKRYELLEIFWKYGSVRVRQVGHWESMTLPWTYIEPWKRKIISSQTVMRAVGEWLFGRNRVYRLSEPSRVLKQSKIHWDRQTCDLEDEDGQVFRDIPWDDLEFWDPVECHFPNDE